LAVLGDGQRYRNEEFRAKKMRGLPAMDAFELLSHLVRGRSLRWIGYERLSMYVRFVQVSLAAADGCAVVALGNAHTRIRVMGARFKFAGRQLAWYDCGER